LDTVSTTCGSGWVDDPHAISTIDFESEWLTHPLPQVVLTVRIRTLMSLTFEANPFIL